MAENILKQAAKYGSNNPAAYGIVNATEVSGFKVVSSLTELYALADCILSASKTNENNDAIGQEWYVAGDGKYALTNWANRNSASGWTKVTVADSATVTALANRVTTAEGNIKTNSTSISSLNTTVATKADKSAAIGSITGTNATLTIKSVDGTTISKTVTINNVAHATSADTATKATQDGDGKVIADTYATQLSVEQSSVVYVNLLNKKSDELNFIELPAFTGATDTLSGNGGLVPCPSANDNYAQMYLCADGTWKVVDLTSAVNNAYTTASVSGNTLTLTKGDGTTKTTFTPTWSYTLPAATASVKGGVYVPASNGLTLASDGKLTATVATSTVLGSSKLGSDTKLTQSYTSSTGTSNRTYAVQVNSNGQMGVCVPWTDNNTTYSSATTSTLGLIKVSAASESTATSNMVQLNTNNKAFVEKERYTLPIWTTTTVTSAQFTAIADAITAGKTLVASDGTVVVMQGVEGTSGSREIYYEVMQGTMVYTYTITESDLTVTQESVILAVNPETITTDEINNICV